jgi:hypothetical protein
MISEPTNPSKRPDPEGSPASVVGDLQSSIDAASAKLDKMKRLAEDALDDLRQARDYAGNLSDSADAIDIENALDRAVGGIECAVEGLEHAIDEALNASSDAWSLETYDDSNDSEEEEEEDAEDEDGAEESA